MGVDLSNEAIEDRFFLRGRMEILSVLNDLIHRRESVTVSFNGGRDYFQTILLEARPEALVFDLGGDVAANARLPQGPGCVFTARPDGIRVQFSGGPVQRFSWGGADAFWMPLPDRVVRLQRRESFRIVLPVAKGLAATLYDASGQESGRWPLRDISVGGCGARLADAPVCEVGQLIARVSVRLPERGWVDAAARVCHAESIGGGEATTQSRAGFAFVDLPRSMEVAIQRYIIEIEHARRAIAAG